MTFSGATWSAISASVVNATDLALTLVEWGVTPVGAAAPWNSPAVSSERRLYAVKQYGAATPRRHLSAPALASVAENTSAANVDTLIGRGLDTHVTSITLVTGNGMTVTSWSSRPSDATTVFFTIPYTAATLPAESGASSSPATGLDALYVRKQLAPLRLSLYAHPLFSPHLGLQSAFTPMVVNLTCPDSAPSASQLARIGTRVPAVLAAPSSEAGRNVTAWIAKVSTAPSTLESDSVAPGGAVFTVTVDCGAAVGYTNVSCALDSTMGTELDLSYTCPQLHWTPACGYGEKKRGSVLN